jgi:hypothetical protein
LDGKATEVEEAARKLDSRFLFQISKDLGRKNFSSKEQVRKKDGQAAVTEKEQLQRWAEHFEEVLNREEPQISTAFSECETMVMDCSPQV